MMGRTHAMSGAVAALAVAAAVDLPATAVPVLAVVGLVSARDHHDRGCQSSEQSDCDEPPALCCGKALDGCSAHVVVLRRARSLFRSAWAVASGAVTHSIHTP